ncbi:MAG: hypothetical protein H7335_11635 [Massilia sp.]|nr:hypothetical protein [Massilia sp.]
MKTNLQYIFDKITRQSGDDGKGDDLDKAALIELTIALGASDRGVAISVDIASFVADVVLASRTANRAEMSELRASLSHEHHVPAYDSHA